MSVQVDPVLLASDGQRLAALGEPLKPSNSAPPGADPVSQSAADGLNAHEMGLEFLLEHATLIREHGGAVIQATAAALQLADQHNAIPISQIGGGGPPPSSTPGSVSAPVVPPPPPEPSVPHIPPMPALPSLPGEMFATQLYSRPGPSDLRDFSRTMLGNSNQLDSLAADTRSIARAIAEHWIDGKHNAANNTEKHATWLDSAGTHAEDVSTAAEAVAAAFDKAKVHTPTPHEFADARADIAEANRINDMTGGLMHGRVVAAMSHYAQLQADAVAAMTEYHAEATAALAHIDEPLKPAPPIAGGIPAGHLATMTDADRAALRDYTGDGYQDLNAALRSGILTPDQQARIDAINRALAKLPDYQGIVVRGTDLPQDVLDRYQPGSTVTERAFTSTTTDPAVAGGDFPGNTEFRILSQAGTDVSPYSAYPHESEILFGSGTDFYVQDRFVDPATAKTVIVMIQR